MEGILKNRCRFSIAEILTQCKKVNLKGHIHYYTVFCGLLTKIQSPKSFNVNLYLRKNQNLLTRTLQTKLPFDKLKIKMDSQEIEKMFDVYASNKDIAIQLLTHDVIQLLINFQNEMNMDYELTIKNNCIYIRFISGKMFEAAQLTNISLSKETLYKYYKILDFTFSLTNELINSINDES